MKLTRRMSGLFQLASLRCQLTVTGVWVSLFVELQKEVFQFFWKIMFQAFGIQTINLFNSFELALICKQSDCKLNYKKISNSLDREVLSQFAILTVYALSEWPLCLLNLGSVSQCVGSKAESTVESKVSTTANAVKQAYWRAWTRLTLN